MTVTTYIGVGGKARKIKTAYIGVDGKARKVKKIYVGVGGKAKLCYMVIQNAIRKIGNPTGLSKEMSTVATSVGNYALFGDSSTVDAYNSNLVRSTPTALSQGRANFAAASVGNYALFGGGYAGSYYSTVDAYEFY